MHDFFDYPELMKDIGTTDIPNLVLVNISVGLDTDGEFVTRYIDGENNVKLLKLEEFVGSINQTGIEGLENIIFNNGFKLKLKNPNSSVPHNYTCLSSYKKQDMIISHILKHLSIFVR